MAGPRVGDPRLAALRELATAYARHDPVRSVAVVGNAPLEPSAERAASIDAADLVVRVNSFVLDRSGEPPCVGRRADLVVWSRLVQATPWLFADYRQRLYVMLEPMRMYHRPEVWPASWPDDLGFVAAPNDAVAIPLNEELGLPWRAEQLAPTSGTTAVWLAVNLFPGADVLVTGLSFVETAEPERWGYHSGAEGLIGPEHRTAPESALLHRWIGEGRIRFSA